MYVLDTSAILSAKFFEGEKAIPPSVLNEIKKGGIAWRQLQYMKAVGLKIIAPPKDITTLVKKFASITGDLPNLSEVDIDVLALAFYLKATLLTDDYSMQNVAKEMGIDYKSILQDGIKEKFHWKYRCKSCGRYFDEYTPICPICGGEVKRVRK